jgi:hypothetical protein
VMRCGSADGGPPLPFPGVMRRRRAAPSGRAWEPGPASGRYLASQRPKPVPTPAYGREIAP